MNRGEGRGTGWEGFDYVYQPLPGYTLTFTNRGAFERAVRFAQAEPVITHGVTLVLDEAPLAQT